MKAKTSAMISLDQARMLVAHLEREEFEQADTILADVCAPNAAALFDKVGQLTRQLHNSLQDFRLDPRIPDLATQVYASRDTPHRPGRPTTASVATQAPRVSSEMATDDIATSVHGLMSRSHAETGG